jgi:hypothetical protein
MSTDEPDSVAETTSSPQLPVPANALPDGQKIKLTKFDDSQRQRITDIASTQTYKERDISWTLR